MEKVSILGIGTELCAGQILNKNAQWISQRLQKLGVITTAHLVVPDDRSLILEALQFCQEHSDMIFVTGGLGPTSDDFTRDVIAEFCGARLVFDEESWQMIERRLSERGIPVKDIQKQQCYFPEGSRILKNRNGTANGFSLQWQGTHFYVLPGPPREIEGIWHDELASEMQFLTSHLDPLITRSWDTMGLPESEAAPLTESAVPKDCKSLVEIGYRVHLPYVEVKLTYRRSNQTQVQKALDNVEAVLSSATMARNGEDLVAAFVEKLRVFKRVSVADSVSKGYLFKRLSDSARHLVSENKFQWLTSEPETESAIEEVFLSLQWQSENQVKALLKTAGQTKIQREELISLYYHSPHMSERNLQYVSEKALAFWMRSCPEQ